MTEIREIISCRSMACPEHRKAYMLRYIMRFSWEKVAEQVVNLRGEHPSWVCVKETVQRLSVAKGCRKYKYSRCGRRPWKMTSAIQQFVISRLVARRATQIVTSVTLQADLSAEKGITVEASTIRKLLKRRGYRWLPRNQKRKYSDIQKRSRLAFARAVLRMSKKDLRRKLSMSLDGVVLSMPPTSDTERFNFCWGGATHMWRKRSEGNLPKLADGLRQFRRNHHDGIVLDDMRDFYFCVRHQEKLQGKVDTKSEFASTPSGQHAFSKWLWRVPVVVTANYTTRNRDLLEHNDFLANPNNRVIVERAVPS